MDRRTQQLVEGWIATQASPNTRAAYRRDLGGFVDWCSATGRRPLAATPADIDTYRDSCLSDGIGAATVARRLSALASFFRYAAAAGVVAAGPVDGIERPAPPDPADAPVLDTLEFGALLDSARQLGPKAAALVALLGLEGLKLGETLAIDVGDVALGRKRPSVAVTRRGDRTEVPLSRLTAQVLANYIGQRRSGPLFLGDSPVAVEPARLTRFGADFILKRVACTAGIEKPVSANLLRRSYLRDRPLPVE